jgi:2-phosphosulfolactate phosphatase
VVVDVFRASTTIAAALAGGARFVLPVADVEQAMRLAEPYAENEVLLAGERDCQRIEGFQLGNSPREYTREVVAGKVVIFTTTNGTRALAAAKDSGAVFIGCFVNFSAVADAVAGFDAVTVLCAGNNGRLSLEDFACAGGLVARLAKRTAQLDDAALAARAAYKNLRENLTRFLTTTEHARRLAGLGFRADLEFALKVDSVPVVPQQSDGRIEPLPA